MNQFKAVCKGELEMAKTLVTASNVNDKWDGDMAVIHCACWKGHYEMVLWVLKLGANVNILDNRKWTPLHYAVNYSHVAITTLLLDFGADPRICEKHEMIPLHMAQNSMECMSLLIKAYPAGVHALNKFGGTPLAMCMSIKNSEEAQQVLLAAGSNVDTVDIYGNTMLRIAASCSVKSVRLLVYYGAKISSLPFDSDRGPQTVPQHVVISIFKGRDACKYVCFAILELAKRRAKSIGGNGRDVLGLIARMVWESRCTVSWDNPHK